MVIIICTIKSWNIKQAEKLKERYKGMHDIYVVSNKEDLLCEIPMRKPDFVFFPHWSYIVPAEIYENYNCVVFHMTDLPFGRGGSPLQNLIVREICETKISAIKIVEELDAGPIYMKENLKLDGSAEEIFNRAATIIFGKMIPFIIEKNVIPYEQKGTPVLFKRRKFQDGEITSEMPLNKIYDYIRMLDAEGYPDAYINFGRYRLDLSNAEYIDGKLSAKIKFMEVIGNEQLNGE